MRRNVLLSIVTAMTLVACGDDGTAPESYDQIAGSYSGPYFGTTQGVALDAVLSLTLTQSGGSISGSYGIVGTLSDGQNSVDVFGTGHINGSIQRGDNPSVNFTVTPGGCPNQPATFSGSHDSSNGRLTVSGPIYIFDAACQVILTYNSVITMTT